MWIKIQDEIINFDLIVRIESTEHDRDKPFAIVLYSVEETQVGIPTFYYEHKSIRDSIIEKIDNLLGVTEING